MNDLKGWFKDRPRWMQEAAGFFLTQGRLADGDTDTFLEKCLREIGLEDTATVITYMWVPFGREPCFGVTKVNYRLFELPNRGVTPR